MNASPPGLPPFEQMRQATCATNQLMYMHKKNDPEVLFSLHHSSYVMRVANTDQSADCLTRHSHQLAAPSST